MPAYVVAVVVILSLLPESDNASLTVWLANLTLTQIYVPLTLTAGLTQMWSLSVEVSFTSHCPFSRCWPAGFRLARGCRRSPRWGAQLGVGLGAAHRRSGRQPDELAAGVLLLVRRRDAAGGVGAQPGRAAAQVGASPGADGRGRGGRLPGGGLSGGRSGRLGDEHAAQFAIKTAMGSVVAIALVAPLVLDRPDTPHRLLGSTFMVTLGRWSYGLFIWHLAALDMVFPVIGAFAFNGHMPTVLLLTLVFGWAIAAVSYALVESPCREALRRWERRRRRAARQRSRRDSAVARHADAGQHAVNCLKRNKSWSGASRDFILRTRGRRLLVRGTAKTRSGQMSYVLVVPEAVGRLSVKLLGLGRCWVRPPRQRRRRRRA